MITEAEIIRQPQSGEYKERIYDIEDSWKSQSWTWVKFKDDSDSDWCGQFRGAQRKVSISKLLGTGLILTSDFLFEIDLKNGDLLNFEDQPQYHNLTTAPDGSFILADYYTIERITHKLESKVVIESPIKMDMIEFKEWDDDMLVFTCDEFLNWERHLEMIYDNEINKILMRRKPHNNK